MGEAGTWEGGCKVHMSNTAELTMMSLPLS